MRSLHKLLALAAVGATTVAAVASAPAASASSLKNVYRLEKRITQNGHRLCLHVETNKVVDLYPCTTSNAEKWQFGQINGNTFYISVAHSGYALAATSLKAGALMTLKKVNTTDKTQNWQDDVLYNNHGVINNSHATKLVIAPNSAKSRSRVELHTYADKTGIQSWNVIRVS